MEICPRCKEWRTKRQIEAMASVCKRCIKELQAEAKRGNQDQPAISLTNYGIPKR